MNMQALEYFRIGVALLYHEARHVRRLRPQSLKEPASWGTLRSLPDDRLQAWQQVRPFLVQSAKLTSAEAVEGVFLGYFRKNLEELEQIFMEAPWPSNLGGAKWGRAVSSVRALGAVIELGDGVRIAGAVSAIKTAQHNTGTLMEKYRRLESKR